MKNVNTLVVRCAQLSEGTRLDDSSSYGSLSHHGTTIHTIDNNRRRELEGLDMLHEFPRAQSSEEGCTLSYQELELVRVALWDGSDASQTLLRR